MVVNSRDRKTMASNHPQYCLLNVAYRLYVQVFERIENKQYPSYVDEYMERNGVTWDRVFAQQQLIADMFDGLLAKEYTRESSMSYFRKSMLDCRWSERFDWEAMAVFDMLANQSLFAYAWGAIADLASESDITAQNPGELRSIIDRLCYRAAEAASDPCDEKTKNRILLCQSEIPSLEKMIAELPDDAVICRKSMQNRIEALHEEIEMLQKEGNVGA